MIVVDAMGDVDTYICCAPMVDFSRLLLHSSLDTTPGHHCLYQLQLASES